MTVKDWTLGIVLLTQLGGCGNSENQAAHSTGPGGMGAGDVNGYAGSATTAGAGAAASAQTGGVTDATAGAAAGGRAGTSAGIDTSAGAGGGNGTDRSGMDPGTVDNPGTVVDTPIDVGPLPKPKFSLIGFGGKTTGGAGGERVEVRDSGELDSALGGSEKRVVVVMNRIEWGGDTGSNKTILGFEDKGEIVGGTVRIGSNVILRNLTIHSGKKGADLAVLSGSQNVWIDHCEVYNFFGDVNGDGKIDTKGDIVGGDVDMYDGIIDITGSSGDITISWSKIHDGFKAMLKSASGNITFHHNEFYNIWERVPNFRGGEGHLFNNYFHDITQAAVDIRNGAVARVEGNVFERVGSGELDTTTGYERGPIGSYYTGNGCWQVADNIFIDSKGSQPETSSCDYTPPYEYAEHLMPASVVKRAVFEWAGPGKLDPGDL